MRRTRGDREIGVALNLYGVTFSETSARGDAVPDTELVVVRDLAAIVARGTYSAVDPTEEHATQIGAAIAAYAKRSAVLPAPVGVVFRSREAVSRWLELHYVALSDALSFVDDRVVGRVHVWRPGDATEREVGSDLAAATADAPRPIPGGTLRAQLTLTWNERV